MLDGMRPEKVSACDREGRVSSEWLARGVMYGAHARAVHGDGVQQQQIDHLDGVQ
jgi:hypothetical protein